MNTKHTPLPWTAEVHHIVSRDTDGIARNNDNSSVAVAHGPDKESNAAFIVRACNAHDELVAALESALKTAEFEGAAPRPWHFAARAAITKAKGEA